jgi:hypothetical protein
VFFADPGESIHMVSIAVLSLTALPTMVIGLLTNLYIWNFCRRIS